MLIIIIVVFIKYIISKKTFYSNFLLRLLIIGFVGIALFPLSYETMLEMKYKNFPDYVEAEKNFIKDPTNKQLEQKADLERMKMDFE